MTLVLAASPADLQNEATIRANDDNSIINDLNTEILDRTNADNVLQTDINTRALSSSLTTEVNNRINADVILQNDINTRSTTSALTTETNARISNDNTITNNLNTHISDTTNPHQVTAAQTGSLTQVQADLLYEPIEVPVITNSLLNGLTALYTNFGGGNWSSPTGSPTLTNVGGVTSVAGLYGEQTAQFNGVNQWFSGADSDAYHMADHDFTISILFKVPTSPVTQGLVSHTQRIYFFNDNKLYFDLTPSGPTITSAALTRNAWHTAFVWRDYINKTINLQVDGGTIFSASDLNTSISITSTPFLIGTYTTAPLFPNGGNIQEVGVWKRVLTPAERTLVSSDSYPWGGTLNPPNSTTINLLPEHWTHNSYNNFSVDHYQTSQYSELIFETTAERVDITVVDDLFTSFPTFTPFKVSINGILSTVLKTRAAGTANLSASLGTGRKVVSIVGSLQSTGGTASVKGVWPVTVKFPSTDVINVHKYELNRLLIYGDSIASGANAVPPVTKGWSILLRDTAPFEVLMDSWGFRTLWDDANTAALRDGFLLKVSKQTPSILWIAVGTNDYGLNKWNAASFGTAYAALIDLIHAAYPLMTIYCQTPLTRSSEGANGSGSTLGDYRTQISTVTSTRSSWAILVDGPSILSIGDIDVDGLHPTINGHIKYARFVRNLLGY